MEPDDHSIPGLKNIDSSSSASVIDSFSESDKDLVSFFQSLNLSDNQQDNKNARKDEKFDNKETYHPYPLKHGVENCPYYMRTGTCSFGMTCRFNHPIWRAAKVHGGKQGKIESLDQTKRTDCKFNLASGECKDDSTCISRHCHERTEIKPVELNFLGLPIRPGEGDCAFYMQNAACADGIDCRFNHPEPTFDEGSSDRAAADISMEGRVNNEKEIPKQDSNILHHMGTSSQYPAPQSFDVMLSKNFSNPRSQRSKAMFLQEYPERPGQPLCDHFLKTGFCKYKSSCRYHHPKKPSSTVSSGASSKMAFPTPAENAQEGGICKFFEKFCMCKYGGACMLNHPDPLCWQMTSNSNPPCDGS